MQQNISRGILAMLLSSFLFALMSAEAKFFKPLLASYGGGIFSRLCYGSFSPANIF